MNCNTINLVFRGIWKETDVAVKKLSSDMNEHLMEEFGAEAIMMSNMRHPNREMAFT